MAQALDLANERPGLVVRNTFLDFPEEDGGFGGFGGFDEFDAPPRRTRAVSDLTDTKLPWKVPLSSDSGLFRITRHRLSSDHDGYFAPDEPVDSPLYPVSEISSLGSLPMPGVLPPSLGQDPFGISSYPGAPPLPLGPGGLPGYLPPWWYAGAAGLATPPWAAQFPIWGGYPGYPQSPHLAAAAMAASIRKQNGSGVMDQNGLQNSRRGSGKGKKDAPELASAAEDKFGRQRRVNGSGGSAASRGSHDGAMATPAVVGAQVQSIPVQRPEEPTTVMLRHIPNRYTSLQLVDLLDENQFKGLYDFLYLPMDFQNKVNLGYCFVNLQTNECALRFHKVFENYTSWRFDSSKASEVSWAHPHQGLDEHVERYRNSPVMHPSMPAEYKPMLFKNGHQTPFPNPTRVIKAPKVRVHRDRPGIAQA